MTLDARIAALLEVGFPPELTNIILRFEGSLLPENKEEHKNALVNGTLDAALADMYNADDPSNVEQLLNYYEMIYEKPLFLLVKSEYDHKIKYEKDELEEYLKLDVFWNIIKYNSVKMLEHLIATTRMIENYNTITKDGRKNPRNFYMNYGMGKIFVQSHEDLICHLDRIDIIKILHKNGFKFHDCSFMYYQPGLTSCQLIKFIVDPHRYTSAYTHCGDKLRFAIHEMFPNYYMENRDSIIRNIVMDRGVVNHSITAFFESIGIKPTPEEEERILHEQYPMQYEQEEAYIESIDTLETYRRLRELLTF